MEVIDEILEFSLHGNGVTPRSFKSKEVGEILFTLEDAIKAYILENTEDIKESEIFLSPIAIIDESLTLRYFPNIRTQIIAAYVALSTAINTNNFIGVPQRSIDSLRAVQRIIRSKNCQGDFRINGQTIGQIDGNTQLAIPESQKIKGDTIIYGQIQRVGGVEPKVRIVLDDKTSISLEVTEEIAIKLAHKLYKEVGFRGEASWTIIGHKLIDFKVLDVIDTYEPVSIRQSFNELSAIASKYWDGIEYIEEYLLND